MTDASEKMNNLFREAFDKSERHRSSKRKEDRRKEKKKHKKKHHHHHHGSRERSHKRHHHHRSSSSPELSAGRHHRKKSSPPPLDPKHQDGPRFIRYSESPPPQPNKKPRQRSKSRSPPPPKRHHYSRSPPKRSKSKSPLRWRQDSGGYHEPSPPQLNRIDMSVEERDLRTVFVMQLANRVRTRDLVQFFSSCGKVNDVKIITDSKTKRSKGIAYIEFEEIESVNHALGLNGKKLLGVPIIVQPSQAEKNRSASGSSLGYLCRPNPGPMRLYVGSLHFNVTEAMLQELFGPFGPIDSIELLKDGETGRSRGYGFINFCDAEHAKRAMDHLNGYELSGRPIRVGHVTEKTELLPPSHLDTDELDRNGIDLGPTGRLQLMAKLAEGTGLKIPQAALNALHGPVITPTSLTTPAAATQCLMLSNMFDRYGSKPSSWELEIRNDVIEECRRHGGALHVAVDKDSHGNVYVKCPSINVAVDVVKALHGRWFAGRIISAAFVPVINYHTLFTEAITATTPL